MARYSSADAKEFIRYIAPIIVREGSSRGYHIFSATIAQAVIEGACGRSELARDYHNHFGLKAGKAWLKAGKPSKNMKTNEEYTPGKLTSINDYFRVYANDTEGVKGYYDFISTARYANLKEARDYHEFISFLKKDEYATSSTYIQTLTSTVEKYDLQKYDNGAPADSAPSFQKGKTYTTLVNLNIREKANGPAKSYNDITDNAKEHAYSKDNGDAVLMKDTRVTCRSTTTIDGNIWMEIPSGWIAAYYHGKTYIQ